jgi:hypothetical protein
MLVLFRIYLTHAFKQLITWLIPLVDMLVLFRIHPTTPSNS